MKHQEHNQDNTIQYKSILHSYPRNRTDIYFQFQFLFVLNAHIAGLL